MPLLIFFVVPLSARRISAERAVGVRKNPLRTRRERFFTLSRGRIAKEGVYGEGLIGVSGSIERVKTEIYVAFVLVWTKIGARIMQFCSIKVI